MSENFFNWLLKLYPRRFQREYGEAMRQLFQDRLREETGFVSRARLTFDILLDLAISVPREHSRPDSAAPIEPGRYRLSEEAIARMARGRHSRELWVAFGSIGVCYVIAWMGGAPRLALSAIYGLAAVMGMMAVVRHSSRFKHTIRGYALMLNEDEIQQTGGRLLPRSLHRSEMAKLTEYNFGTMIEAQERSKSIWVPSGITGYEDLKTRLSAWAPLEPAASEPVAQVRRLVPLVMVGLLPAALLARSAYAVVALIALSLIPLGLLSRQVIEERAAHPRSFKVVWLLPVVFAALLAWKSLTLLR